MGTTQTDLALIDACLRGEGQAVEELWVRFHGAIHAGACKAIGQRLAICGTVDDLTDQFFLQVIECPNNALHGFADRSDFASWLTAVAYRQCSKILRSHAWRWPGTSPIEETLDLDRLATPIHQELHAVDVVRRAMQHLDADSRAIIDARFGLGTYEHPLSIQEIADRDGCGRATVYRHLREALRRLRAVAEAVQAQFEG